MKTGEMKKMEWNFDWDYPVEKG